MLDISIPQVTSKFKTADQILSFMQTKTRIEAKTDGVKLTLVKINDSGTLDDWIVAYKGQIFYRGEFEYIKDTALADQVSIGNSQFDKVFDHLEKLKASDYNKIPNNTEIFCEFLVTKNTVMSEYTKTGTIIVLGHGKAKPELRFGKLKTNSESFETANVKMYADALKLITPPVLFEGVLFPADQMLNGIKNKVLASELKAKRMTLKSLETDPLTYFNTLVEAFVNVESEFGGKEEGIVLHQGNQMYKAQQTYQLDREARSAKKLRWMEDDPKAEQAYWDDVLEVSKQIANSIQTQDIKTGLNEIAKRIKQLNFEGVHSKKNQATVMDDIQTNAKMFYLKALKGNNGGLVFGKFRILTNGHVKMIDKARKECDEIVIGLVTSADTKDTKDLRLEALKKAFPDVRIIELVSGNIFTALKKAEININHLYAGSDRKEDYERQLLKAPGISVNEIERSDADISATKVIQNLADYAFFKQNTPKAVHSLYPKYQAAYQVFESY